MTKNKGHSNSGITLVTTHINADFDAMASMLAAQKLYPGSLAVFPGSHEKNLRNFFVHSMVYLMNMADVRDIDFSKVARLVLVDTKQKNRIGKLADLLDRMDIEVHIYDHHPLLPDDIRGHHEVLRQTGATVSILAEIIREKGIEITPDEATVMCLGIYEDTGSFTFTSTTEQDFLAAAFLHSKGANLDVISNLITREISTEQIAILNDMFQALTHYSIKGVDIVLTSIASEKYIPDFAFLVQKMMRMENLNAVFAVARMSDKVYVVARSKTPDVDVGDIVTELGGGGHAFAAAATIKDKTLAQTENRLLEILRRKVRSSMRAKDLMSSPAITTAPNTSCREARNILTRYNINALLVTEKLNGDEKLLGFITRQVISKALYLKLENASVGEYMTTEMGTVAPNSELPEIQDEIIEKRQRVLPVVKNEKVKGIITRTDLLNTLVRKMKEPDPNPPDPYKEDISARIRNVVRIMKERLSNRLLEILKKIGEVGGELGYGVYVVGGFVRDLFMYRPNEDIDIVVEGNGIAFARRFAAMMDARVHAYSKFGTAVITFKDGFKIDVASARMEHYRFPADLPTVEMSSIKIDLYRRDFTVNTLAIHLNPDRYGTLIDFYSALRDIKEKSIRVLHNLSFVEDPTRVFRAIRFEQRFGFTIGKLTSGLIENAVKMDFFRKLSGRRFFSELRLILEEENPAPAIKRLHDYDLLKILHPSIKPTKKLMSLFDSVKQVLSWHDLQFLDEPCMKWAVYFSVLIGKCVKEQTEGICDKLELAPKHRAIFMEERFHADNVMFWLQHNMPVKNSELHNRLSPFRLEMVLYMMAASRYKKTKKAISQYLSHFRFVRTSVAGKDLKRMGLLPGPIYREILQSVLDAKLDGTVKTRNDELNYAKNFITRNNSADRRKKS